MESALHDEGAIFGYLALPLVLTAICDVIWDIVTNIFLGFDVDFNTYEYVTGKAEIPDVDNSPKSMIFLNAHAWIGSTGILIFGFYVLSGAVFSTPCSLEIKAYLLAPATATVWALAVVSGAYYMFTSQRSADKQADWSPEERRINQFIHICVGVAVMVNLGIGIESIFSKDNVRHRGAMYFAFYWGSVANVTKFLNSLVQSTYPNAVEKIPSLRLAIVAVVLSIETPLYAYIGYRFGGKAYRRKFVTYNLCMFSVMIVFGWIVLILAMAFN